MSRDQKVVTLLPIMEKLLFYGLLSRSCFYHPHLIAVAPLSLDIKRFAKVTYLWVNSFTTSWGRVPNKTFWMRFTCCPNFNVSSFLMEWDIQIFKLVILLTLSSLVILLTWSSSQLIVIFLTLSKSQMTHLYYIGQAIGVLLVWARH